MHLQYLRFATTNKHTFNISNSVLGWVLQEGDVPRPTVEEVMHKLSVKWRISIHSTFWIFQLVLYALYDVLEIRYIFFNNEMCYTMQHIWVNGSSVLKNKESCFASWLFLRFDLILATNRTRSSMQSGRRTALSTNIRVMSLEDKVSLLRHGWGLCHKLVTHGPLIQDWDGG